MRRPHRTLTSLVVRRVVRRAVWAGISETPVPPIAASGAGSSEALASDVSFSFCVSILGPAAMLSIPPVVHHFLILGASAFTLRLIKA